MLPRSGAIFFPQSLLELPEAQFGGNFQISPYGYIAAVDKGRKGGEISKLTESTSKWLSFQTPKASTILVQRLELRNSFFLKITSKSTISTLQNSENNVFQRIVSFKIVGRWLMWLLTRLCPLFSIWTSSLFLPQHVMQQLTNFVSKTCAILLKTRK